MAATGQRSGQSKRALLVAVPQRISARLTHYLLCQVAGDLLRAPVPKTDAPLPIQEVDAYRQLLQDGTVARGIIQQVGHAHTWPAMVIGKKGVELQELEGTCRLRPRAAASKTGGWQVNPEQRTAKERFSFRAGRLGMVWAKAGGRFCGTA